ncbi:periplasmic binding protein-like II [Neocallimastix sp. 'constans']
MILQLLIILAIIYINKAIVINGITNTCYKYDLYSRYISEFNKYSNTNNLNITLNLEVFTKENSTVVVSEYETVLESLLKRKTTQYDLFFYDNIFTFKYGPHLLPLKEWLPEDHFKIYEGAQILKTCYYNDSWPIKTDVTVLYYNDKYLNKYNKTVPKTWDDLLDTSRYILNEERKQNNDDFIAYNGLFSYTEIGMCSLYEFIYSFRNNIDSPFPDIRSQETIESLKMMKTLKQEISSDEIFQKLEEFTEEKFDSGNFLFQKFWYCPWIHYNFTILPGKHENVSGSALGGYNLGINKYIKDSRKKAVAIVYKFLTSIEMQKKLLKDYGFLTAIPSIYNDKEICSNFNCKAMKKIQLIERPTAITKNYSSYSEKFRNYIYEYLYGNETAENVLKKIKNIVEVHNISIKGENNEMGLLILIVSLFFIILMLLSLVILFMGRFKPYFSFLPTDFWIVLIIGQCLVLSSELVTLGELKVIKCLMKTVNLCIGFTFHLIPILYKLMSNFPLENELSSWISRNRYLFLMFFTVLDILMNAIFFIEPYEVSVKAMFNNKKYHACVMKNTFGSFIEQLMIIHRIIITIAIILLVYIEWSITIIHKELKTLSSAIIIDLFCYIIFFILRVTDTKIKNYESYNFILFLIVLVFSLSNYTLLYVMKIIKIFIDKRKTESIDVQMLKNQFNSKNKDYSISNQLPTDNSNKSLNVFEKITKYHYQKSIQSCNSLNTYSNNELKQLKSNDFANKSSITDCGSGSNDSNINKSLNGNNIL